MILKHNAFRLSEKKPLPAWLPWLTHRDSLTQKLQGMAGDASLQVLTQSWEAPNEWDQRALMITDTVVMHREILMTAWDEPCWYARTILPLAAYNADEPFFDRLKHETLGDLIFNTPYIKRIDMMYYEINQQSIEHSWVSKVSLGFAHLTPVNNHWVRLSAFSLNNNPPFFLLEVLLPGLERYLV